MAEDGPRRYFLFYKSLSDLKNNSNPFHGTTAVRFNHIIIGTPTVEGYRKLQLLRAPNKVLFF